MTANLKLPVGIESFEEMFWKTLNMSMLKCFFETGMDETLFDGLYIKRNKELCDEYMGKYPVIFLSLKGVEGLTFNQAKYRITELCVENGDQYG